MSSSRCMTGRTGRLAAGENPVEPCCSYNVRSAHPISSNGVGPWKSLGLLKAPSFGRGLKGIVQVSASGTLPHSSQFDDATNPRTPSIPRNHSNISPQGLTRRIKEAETWHKLLLLLRSHQGQMDHIHICALLSRAAHLHGGSLSWFDDEAEKEQYNNFISDLVVAAQSYLSTYTARAVASTVYALAVLGVRNTEFLDELTQLAAQKFTSFNPQELANMMWGLAKHEYRPSEQWMESFFQASEVLMWKFKPQELCNTAYSLAVLGIEADDQWQNNFLTVVAHQTKNFKPQDFSNLAWAMATMDWVLEESWLEDFVAGSEPLLNYFKPQELCNMAWGLAVMGHDPPASWLSAFLATTETKMQLINSQDMANLLWSCARLGARPNQFWVDSLLDWGSGLLGSFKGQDLANVLWALTELDVQVKDQYKDVLLLAVFDQAADLAAPDLATVLYVLTKKRWSVKCPKDLRVVLLQALESKASQLSGAQMSNVLWALSHSQWKVPVKVLEGLVTGSCSSLSSCDNSQLVVQIGALARLQHRPNEAWLKTWLDITQQRLHSFIPSHLSDCIWALTRLPTFVSPRRAWVDAFTSASQPLLQRFTPAELSRTVLCISKLDRHPGQDWMAAFDAASINCINEASPDNVVSQLDGVVKLRYSPSKKWLASIGLAIQRHHDGFTDQQLEIMLALLIRLNKGFALALFKALPTRERNVSEQPQTVG